MDITLAISNDWQALYIDGKIALQKSILTVGEVMDLVVLKGGKVTSYDEKYCSNSYIKILEQDGYFPNSLNEVEFAG